MDVEGDKCPNTMVKSEVRLGIVNHAWIVTAAISDFQLQLVEAPRYKPAGRGFDSRWCQWIFSLA
jgi:hypothetical protein